MAERVIRLRLNEEIYRKYKVICAELDLSMPKQNAKLIEKFIETYDDNVKILKKLKRI